MNLLHTPLDLDLTRVVCRKTRHVTHCEAMFTTAGLKNLKFCLIYKRGTIHYHADKTFSTFHGCSPVITRYYMIA